MGLPFISCQCLTYGRVTELEEAIMFFLNQDYPGPKELVIVNDLAEQTLVYDHPEVRIFNLKERFPTLGEKRNFAVEQCRGDFIVVYDDDDGYLPHHLSLCARLALTWEVFSVNKCFYWTNFKEIEISRNAMSQWVYSKRSFQKAGGYICVNSGEDQSLLERLIGNHGRKLVDIRNEDISFMLRWANNNYHLSGFGKDRKNEISGYEKIKNRIRLNLDENLISRGRINLNPRFRYDYYKMVDEFFSKK